jgi:hypothetical protein
MSHFEGSYIWSYIEDNLPDLKKKIFAEYNKRNGFVPYEQGYVYLIHAVGTNFYKIGKSVNPDRRILQIAPQMPFPVRFVYVWKSNFMSMAEVFLHETFQEYRANGEWFAFEVQQLTWLLHVLRDDIKHAYVQTFYKFIQREELDRIAQDFGFSDWGMLRIEKSITASDELKAIEGYFASIGMSLDIGFPEDIETQVDRYVWGGLDDAPIDAEGGVS